MTRSSTHADDASTDERSADHASTDNPGERSDDDASTDERSTDAAGERSTEDAPTDNPGERSTGASDAPGSGAYQPTDPHPDTEPTFEMDAVFDPEFYPPTVEELLGPDRAEADVDFLEDRLALSADDRVLDAPCGHGRHANRLAGRGYDVYGLDRSEPFLDRAREDARERGVESVHYRRGDMRDLPYDDASFDAAYNVFTSFGFFDEAGNRRQLRELARVLRPGGRLVLEAADKEAMLSDYRAESVTELENGHLVETREYDPVTCRNRTDRLVVLDGEVREGTYEVRVYGYRELEGLLEDAGFAVRELYGNMDGDPYSLETGRVCVVAEREE